MNYVKEIIIILSIILLGLFVVNQTLEFYYKSEFLQSPCGLCQKLNPLIEPCFNNIYEEQNQQYDVANINMTNVIIV